MNFPKDKRVSGLWKWVMSRMTQEVPEEIANCEFACRKTECLMGEWNTCANRKRGIDSNQSSDS